MIVLTRLRVPLFVAAAMPLACYGSEAGGLPELARRVTSLESSVNTVQANISTLQAVTNTMQAALAALQTQVSSLSASSSTLTSAVASLQTQTAALNAADSAAAATLVTLTSDVGALKGTVATLAAQPSLLSRAHVVVKSYDAPANDLGVFDGEARCPPGEIATGGGSAAGHDLFIISASNPEPVIGGSQPPFGWLTSVWKDNAVAAAFTVWAVCIPVS